MAVAPYSLELAEEHIAKLIGQVDRLTEILAQNDFGGVPNTPSRGCIQYSASGQQKYVDPVGATYSTGTLRQQISPHNQSVTSTTPGAVGGLSASVAAGTYLMKAWITATTGATAGVRNYRITGPAISENELFMRSTQLNTSTAANGVTSTAQSANTGDGNGYNSGFISSQAMSSSGVVYLDEMVCEFVFTAAGTLALQAAEGTGGDSWTVDYGFREISPLT
jgi:hypothetical protein